ncbi:hypothetical protein SLNWT_1000 [Streptomyces albus]|uniref:Integral membrane protein n=1 Tax=Streptomyces albus (strain ATCC 21838 / DSM 41398 / FERM P-419 / JCM 4703 / NBRC 107858) TaxID=1081613 RepID=A0A0B5ERK6_STRA4|nr:hypothetical protein SLNWT_1000 [Streptomyces albus]AOU75692.1 hypothetical protein SLNHY_1001 [Streptomyces albus]AYN31494.1 hypothetical protein DUI70_0991 [Streptomyces albus]
MCWSATADLVAGAAVTAVGAASVAAVRRPGDLPLAALPLLLGAHQIIESVIWRADGGTGPATVAWAVIALPLLPFWVPLGVLCAARPGTRRRLLPLLVLGTATAAALTQVLLTRTVRAEVRGHTMAYAIGLPYPELLLAGYLLATLGPLLLSRDRLLVLLGALASAGALLCGLLWRLEFISTWCAFAALCSVVLLAWARGRRRAPGPRRDGHRTPL